MLNICIRDAKESDLGAIRNLIIELIDSINDREGFDINATYRNCQNILKEDNSYFLVARIDESIAGFINFTVRNTILHDAPSGLIDELVVARAYRNRGVGKRLLQAAIEKCKKIVCCEIEVSTEFSNNGAIKFYKKAGFKERGMTLEMDL